MLGTLGVGDGDTVGDGETLGLGEGPGSGISEVISTKLPRIYPMRPSCVTAWYHPFSIPSMSSLCPLYSTVIML